MLVLRINRNNRRFVHQRERKVVIDILDAISHALGSSRSKFPSQPAVKIGYSRVNMEMVVLLIIVLVTCNMIIS